MHTRIKQTFALLTMLGLAACGGGGIPGPSTPTVQTGAAVLTKIVGVGDSLTAGEQANGLLGVPTTSPVSTFPNALCGGGAGVGCVPATQENGFWSDLYQLATGATLASMFNPATSPLPLIAPPGLLAQLVPASNGLPAPTHSSCDSFNQAAYSLATAPSTRVSPTTVPLDLGVPGLTVHEALFMNQPTAPTCLPLPASDPTDQLQPVLGAENTTYWPVLQNFSSLGTQLSPLNAAISLHPTLTTVWLGANDLLKYGFSGGQAPSDTPAQMQADLTSIITQLQRSGSQVVVANLPDVLLTPQFTKGGAILAATLQAPQLGVPAAYANAAATYIQNTYSVSTAGNLTLNGLIKTILTIQAVIAAGGPPSAVQPALTNYSDYFNDTFSAQFQGLNTAYNASIAAAASATGAPMVDVHAIFTSISNPATNPYANLLPARGCCNLTLFGGLLSFDGIHPSNTGYAIIANAFAATINGAYGTSVRQYTTAQLAGIAATDPY